MGTSLEVQPCASLINFVRDDVPRLLINREIVGQSSYYGGLLLNTKHNTRDFVWLGDCDDGVQVIADRLGFGVSKPSIYYWNIINIMIVPMLK